MASYAYDTSRPRYYDYDINERTRYDPRPAHTHSRRDTAIPERMSDRLQPDYSSYDRPSDSRYSYPGLPSRSRSRGRRSPHDERRQWPPPPRVDEEKTALAQEFRPRDSTPSEDVAPSRGTVDQEPIILEVPEFIHDRRFVLVPSDAKTNPTPPTSDDERTKRGRRKAPKLETVGLPEMRRESSPYSWTRPAAAPSKRFSGDMFLSPDSVIPPTKAPLPSAIPRSVPASDPSAASLASSRISHGSTRRERTPSRRPSPYSQAGATSSEEDRARNVSRNAQRRSARWSYTSSSDVDVDTPPSARERACARDEAASSPRTWQDQLPDHAPYENDLPDKLAKPTPIPLKPAGQRHSRHASENWSSPEFRGSSPNVASTSYPPSPPRSPRVNHDRPRDVPPVFPSSRPGSQSGSIHSSPQPSPSLSKSSLAAEALWGAFAASNSTHVPKQSSCLSSTTWSESAHTPRSTPSSSTYLPNAPSSSTYLPNAPSSSNLPYPDDDRVFQSMPSEEDHLYYPTAATAARSNLQTAFEESSRPVSRTGTPSSSTPISAERPPLPTRKSTLRDFPGSPTSPRNARSSSSSIISKAKTPAQLKALARPLPLCPRQGYSGSHADWYTLEGCPGFDICPACLEAVFGDTTYRCHFKLSPPRPLIEKGLQVKCDFADAWVRLGWLLTVQREMHTLDLIKTLVNSSPPSDSDEACPGAAAAVRNWYSIRDRDGHFLRGFAVCHADVKKLKILFPGFRELWQPLPMRASYSYTDDFGGLMRSCSLRPALNNRFPQYIDTLVRIHEPSYQAGRMPDASEFVSLVRRKTLLHECTRDDMLREQAWHFIPSLLPAFTVCEDCYDQVVLPALEADADVAMRFNREAQPVYGEGRFGLSCQLYSSRMRKIFQRAVKDNDLKYLARKALDRKEMEDELQERVADINKFARRLKGSSGGYGLGTQAQAEMDRLKGELDDLADEWTRWE